MTRKLLSLSVIFVGLAGLAYAGNWVLGEWRHAAMLADRKLSAGARDISVKPERECPPPEDTLVFVIFGQSNAANHGEVRTSAPPSMSDFHGDRCFNGDDPQFSATGDQGSPWPSFAHALRARGEALPILTATVAVGNTRADEWQADTENGATLRETVAELQKRGYRITAFFYFQGEADRETPEADYLAELEGIAATTGRLAPDAPLVLSNSSICGAGRETSIAALRRARQSVAGADARVIVGPDTDTLGLEYRYDGCHFNQTGLEIVGKLWADIAAARRWD